MRLLITLTDATASGSSTAGTISPTTALIAGWVSAVAIPPSAASPSISGIVCSPVATSTPSAIDGGTAHRLPVTTTARRLRRSASAPPNGASSRNGRNWATRLSATANGHALSWRIPQPNATY